MLEPQLADLAEPEGGAPVLALQRDLLQTQLRDLDSFVSQARKAGLLEDGSDDPPAAPGLESLLRAQLREVQSWLEEVRRREPVTERPPFRAAYAEERLLLSLHHARARGRQRQVDRAGPAGETTLVRGQRLEAARDGLLRARDSETLRRLALERAHGVRLQSSEDLARLGSQLRALETDPRGRPELARYAPTDVALAFVGAIEQRRALVRSLSDALSAHHALRSSVETYEQLLACARAEALPALQGGGAGGLARPPEARPATAAPAGRLVLVQLAGGAAAEARGGGAAAAVGPQAARLQNLAERNAELWALLAEQLSGQGIPSVPSMKAPPPLLQSSSSPESPGGAGFPLGTELSAASPSALQSELRALRAKEGRLDELLGTAGGGGAAAGEDDHQQRVVRFADAADHHQQRHHGAVSSTAPPPPAPSSSAMVPAAGSMQPGDDAAPEVRTGFLSGLPLREVLEAWFHAAHAMHVWRRSRREEVVRQMLGTHGVALALVALLAPLVVHAERPLHQALDRGAVVREVGTRQVGTLCSVTPKGICKVAFKEGGETRLVNMAALKWLEPGPHPALAGLCFHCWGLEVKKARGRGIVLFRDKLMSSRHGYRNKSTIVRLASAGGDDALFIKLIFEGWKNMRQAANARILDFLAEAWFVWRRGVLCSRHSRAVSELEVASGELHHARMAVLRNTQRFERLTRVMEEMSDMHNLLRCSWVMNAWQWAGKVAKVRRGLEEAARDEKLQVADILTQNMDKRSTATLVSTLFKAWADSMSRRRQLFKVIITRKMATEEALLSICCRFWASLRFKRAEAKMLSAELRAEELKSEVQQRAKDMEQLQVISQDMFGFASDSTGKVQQLEQALAAAQQAMQVTESHSNLLTEQVTVLEEQLEYEALVPGEARARLAVQLHRDTELRSEVHAIDFDRTELYSELRDAHLVAHEERVQAIAEFEAAGEARRRTNEALHELQDAHLELEEMQKQDLRMRPAASVPSQPDPNRAAGRIQQAYRDSVRRASLERQSQDLLNRAGTQGQTRRRTTVSDSYGSSSLYTDPLTDSEEEKAQSKAKAKPKLAPMPIPKVKAKSKPAVPKPKGQR